MEDKKIIKLNDETLETVIGGAYCKYNEETRRWDVYKSDGTFFDSFSSRKMAERAVTILNRTGD